jgi:hypothetical protein
MNIFKLNYVDKDTAIADLIAKGVYVEITDLSDEPQLVYANGTQAVVDIGQIVKVPGEYDDQGNVIVEPIYFDGVFYDVMTTEDIDFGTNEVFPVECVHSFAGYAQNADGPVDELAPVIIQKNK